MKRYLLIALLFGSVYVFGQKETNFWYFGKYAGLDFNSGQAVALLNGTLDTREGCASISNANGDLLFYTDGTYVYNRNHEVMENGDGLFGDSSSTHSAIIVPKPSNPLTYYIFTVDYQASPNGLRFSEVNMSLDDGLGAVTELKNVLLYTPTTEKITAIKNPISKAYWVVSHAWNSSEFIAYEVTKEGVLETPVISDTGSVVSGPISSASGSIKISPDGTKLAVARQANLEEVQLFEFNAVTGQVGNLITSLEYKADAYPYGVEFSPDSRKLYVSLQYEGVYQYDLSEGTSKILSSETLISQESKLYGALQLAADGKIYVACYNKEHLDIIHEPNNSGFTSNYENEGVSLAGRLSQFGLPPFIQSFFKMDAIEFEQICFSHATSFFLADAFDSVTWNFGDPASGNDNLSNELSPTHVFSAPGTYLVTIEGIIGFETFSETAEVTIYDSPDIKEDHTFMQCDDDSDGLSVFNLNEMKPLLTAHSDVETIQFYTTEQGAEMADAFFLIPNPEVYENRTLGSDQIWARVENDFGCHQVAVINLMVIATKFPSDFEPLHYYACDDWSDQNEILGDGISFFNFSDARIRILDVLPPDQELEVTFYNSMEDAYLGNSPIQDPSAHRNESSPFYQEIYVRVMSTANFECFGIGPYVQLHVYQNPIFEVDQNPILCLNDLPLTLSVFNAQNPEYSYEWYDQNQRLISNSSTAEFVQPGIYNVLATSSQGCSSRPIEINVTASEIAQIRREHLTVTDDLEVNSISIAVHQLGQGDYEFALISENGNQSEFQTEPYFDNILPGIYTLLINDQNNCGLAEINVSVIGFPHFFSPNNDGYNDFWNVSGINEQFYSKSKINIYDRYGKLVTVVDPIGNGWDGTLNGIALPATDYWFSVLLVDDDGQTEEHKGHFSLVR